MNLLDRLLEHDRWTTRQVFIVCRTLTLEQLQKPFELGQGTIDETLRHMIRNVQVWTDLMRTRPVQPRAHYPRRHRGTGGAVRGDLYRLCRVRPSPAG